MLLTKSQNCRCSIVTTKYENKLPSCIICLFSFGCLDILLWICDLLCGAMEMQVATAAQIKPTKCRLQGWGEADIVCHVLSGYSSSGIEIGTLARQAKKRMANASRFYNSLPLVPTTSYILSWWCFRRGKMVRGWRVQKLCRSISFVVSNRSFQIQRYI